MRLWMYKRPETAELVESKHGEDGCLHCEYVNEHVSCDALGVSFICGEDGSLRRVECVIAGTPRMLVCEATTAEEADKEIGAS